MRYRIGKRKKFYRLRHLGFREIGIAVGILTITVIGAAGAGASSRFSPHLLISTMQHHILSAKNLDNHKQEGTMPNQKGSSKPPPRGTTASIHSMQSTATGASTLQATGCAVFPAPHPNLSGSSSPELRKLAQYERLCNGAVASRSSFFTPTPATTEAAQASARAVAATLKAYAEAGITPLVFMEPTNATDGTNLDLSQYANGAYDSVLNTYFATLQANGITSSTMGMWVFVPEGNLPIWSTVDPTVYTTVVTKTAQFQKKYFPSSQSAIMLDSESYAVGGKWGDGKYVSLAPYVQNIPKGLIDSFGLQGFPWAAPANQPASTAYSPTSYLRLDFAVEAARILGITSLWVNTGTFYQMYANQADQTVTLSPAQRQQMLKEVIQNVSQVKAQGLSIAIHLFAQNKANLSEGTDWSYGDMSPNNSDPNTAVLTTFAHDAAAAGLPIWLYDSTSD